MVENLMSHLCDITKIELNGEGDPFLIYRGSHPQPGPNGYPWQEVQGEMIANRVSLFEGLNRHADPSSKWYDHYLLEDTSYDKICDLFLFFDFGLDQYIHPDTQELHNSNSLEKMTQRRAAASQVLRHFRSVSISILSFTSQFLIFAVNDPNINNSQRKHLAEALWNHNNIYYPRPRRVMSSDAAYSLEHQQNLSVERGVFVIGRDD